jgi:shikimate kinase
MARVGHAKNRPLLSVPNPLERLREIFLRRDPLYHQTAHYALDAERMSREQQLAFIVSRVQAHQSEEVAGGR